MWRHDPPREEVIRRLHDGAIGEIILLRTYRMHGPVGFHPRQPGESELSHQIRNYSAFNWLNASFFVDWLIHNIDVCCWVKNAWPVNAQGQGARVARSDPDQMLDQYSVEYTFATAPNSSPRDATSPAAGTSSRTSRKERKARRCLWKTSPRRSRAFTRDRRRPRRTWSGATKVPQWILSTRA